MILRFIMINELIISTELVIMVLILFTLDLFIVLYLRGCIYMLDKILTKIPTPNKEDIGFIKSILNISHKVYIIIYLLLCFIHIICIIIYFCNKVLHLKLMFG
jgi:hypothetical protein